MLRCIAGIALLHLVFACSAEDGPAPDEPVVLETGPLDLAVGEERDGICQSWTLDNDEWLFVNAVSVSTGGSFHHSNWFHVPDNQYAGADGQWPCEERGFSEPVAAAVGGVLFAQSTQAVDELQQFPEGVVIPIPPRSKIVGGIHVLNATGEPVSTNLAMTLRPIPEAEVQVKLSGLSLQFESLALPPHARSEFATACAMADEHARQLERPMDTRIYYVLPHYHDLGRGMTLEAYGGAEGDTVIFDTQARAGEPLGQQLDPTFDMSGYEGLRVTCHYDNPRDETVGWGIGDQEMCVFLAFTDSELLWGGGVLGKTASPGEPEMRSGVAHFERDCFLISYPASHF